ncbi:MAG: hypothetical protein IMZ46_12240 [Acidobacteria bacterium]|nr:hypothetical protein [Acidobacteriota bacterium]
MAVTTSGSVGRLEGYMGRLFTFKLNDEEVEEIKEAGRERHYRAFFTNRYAEDDTR